MRAEVRRQARELEAQTRPEIKCEAAEPGWNALLPVLDELLNDWDERERDAVLCFFDGQKRWHA